MVAELVGSCQSDALWTSSMRKGRRPSVQCLSNKDGRVTDESGDTDAQI